MLLLLLQALKALSRRRLSKQREFQRVNGRMKITTALDKVMFEVNLMKTLYHRNIVKLQEIIDDKEENLYLGPYPVPPTPAPPPLASHPRTPAQSSSMRMLAQH